MFLLSLYNLAFFQAADLLRLPYLQPYVLNIHLNSSSPRRHTFSTQQSTTKYIKQTRFLEPEAVTMLSDREKRRSFGYDRALNPSISEAELDSLCSSEKSRDFKSLNRKLCIGSIEEDDVIDKTVSTKSFSAVKSPRFTPAKSPATPKRQATPKIYTTVTDHDLRRKSQTPSSRPLQATRRASLPLSTRTTSKTPHKASIGLLRDVQSPDVSVNAPRIDKMTEFPLASSEDPFLPVRRTSSTSAHCSFTSSPSHDTNSITKDKCTVQILDKSRRTVTRSYIPNVDYVAPLRTRSECSEHNPTTCISSGPCSESGSQQHRFDTSSYQQRAEALEGLLEFSAKLMQQNRFEELSVLLKPFGPEKVSPRETAIWLTKSFKGTVV